MRDERVGGDDGGSVGPSGTHSVPGKELGDPPSNQWGRCSLALAPTLHSLATCLGVEEGGSQAETRDSLEGVLAPSSLVREAGEVTCSFCPRFSHL